jgi:ATP-dependent DNA helicase RecG
MQDVARILKTPIEYLKGVGPQKAELLQKELSIFQYRDLLEYYPYRYIDRSKIHLIRELNSQSQYVQLKGRIIGFAILGQKRGRRLVAQFQDESGLIELVWFQGIKWIQDSLKTGVEYLVFGKPNFFRSKMSIPHPEVSHANAQNLAAMTGLQPLYNSSEKMKKSGLDSKGMAKLTYQLLLELKTTPFPENLPTPLIQKYQFPDRNSALKAIHFPPDEQLLHGVQQGIKFEDFFWFQLDLVKRKLNRQEDYRGYVFEAVGDQFNRFFHEILPFELTNAQKKVLKEIRTDLKTGRQMNRLLQGDVGSGKTIVALMSMLLALDNGFQACMMAPTEILAQQHYDSIQGLVKGLPVKVGLLTGNVQGSERKQILQALKFGELDILIGTHALIEPKVQFENLGLAIVDEQHRFGVAQ